MATPPEATHLHAVTVRCLHWLAAHMAAARAAYAKPWKAARIAALRDAQGLVTGALAEARNGGFTNPRLEDSLQTVHHELEKAILQAEEE